MVLSSDIVGGLLVVLLLLYAYSRMIHGSEILLELEEHRLKQDDDAHKTVHVGWERIQNTEQALQACSMMRVLLLLCIGFVGVYSTYVWQTRHGIIGVLPRLPGLILTMVGLMLMVLLPGRTIPRLWYRLKPRPSRILYCFVKLITFLFKPIIKLTRSIYRAFHVDIEDNGPTEEEILQIVDIGGENGSIEANEREMIQNIFEFNNQRAEDVMTHRTDVTAIWLHENKNVILKTIMDTGLSRYPVYDEDMDDIVGTLNARAYLLNLQRKEERPLRELLRDAYFVPEHVQADVLFRDMQKRKIHMAIVVDEYGGMSGVVTMEDLLEQIVGNIYDEYDPQAENEITQLSEGLWRITGSTSLDDVEEALHVSLTDENEEEREYDTLGGLIFNRLGTIPRDGSHPEIDVGQVHIRVEKLNEHRVEVALVRKNVPKDESLKM